MDSLTKERNENMKTKGRSWKERICALLLAVMMVITWLMPNAAVTVQAAPEDPVDVTFDVKENITSLDNVTITVKEKDNPDAEKQTVTKQDDVYKISLMEGIPYTYTAQKTGYKTASGEFTPGNPASDPSTNTVSVPMELADMELAESLPVSMTADDTFRVRVTNAAEGKSYICNTSDSGVISVSGDVNSGWTLTALKGGSALITVEIEGTDKRIEQDVTVNKHDANIQLEVTPLADSGNNLKEIECKATVSPSTVTGTVSFTVDSLINSGDISIQDGIATWKYTPGNDQVLSGEYNVQAVYSGDEKYDGATTSITTGEYMKDVPLKIQDNAKEDGEAKKTVTFSDGNWNTPFNFPVDESTVENRTLTYSIIGDDKGIIELDPTTGQITPKHAGEVTVRATAEQQNSYVTSSVDYTVVINKKEINHLSDFNWESEISFVYNADKNFQINGTLIMAPEYKVVLDAELESADAGENKTYSIVNKEYEVENGEYADYILTGFPDDETISTTVEVTKRPVYLKVNNTENITVEYGHDYNTLKADVESRENLVSLDGTDGKIESDSKSGYLNGDTAISLPNATFDDTKSFVVSEKYVGDVIEGIVKPDTEKGNAGDNYQFKFDETADGNRGNIEIVHQQLSDADILKYITVSSTGSTIDTRYDNNGVISEIWVSKEAVLKLAVKSEYSAYYDVVKVAYDGSNIENAVDATNDGVYFDQYVDGQQKISLSGKIWLQKSDSNTFTESINGNEGNSLNIVNVDSQSPEVEFTDLTDAGVAGQGLSAITFGVFDNETYLAKVNVNDEAEQGSGIASKRYYVWKMSSEIKDNGLTETAVEEIINNLSDSAWTEFSGDTIEVGTGSTKEEIENNYAVFVETKDKVGNTDIYVSNGLVIEMNPPRINVDMVEKPYYDGDVEYTLTVDDKEDYNYKSAISQIKVTVTCNGEVVDGDSSDCSDSYTINMKKDDNKYSISDIDSLSSKVILGKITAENNNSNDVNIKIEAEDNSGNVAACWEKDIIIDTTDPEITVSFDNDTPKNDKYFNQDRIMTIQYKERNLETDPNENGITFDVIKDGVEYQNCTLADLGSIEGLNIEWVDSKIEDKIGNQNTTEFEEKQYTDERICTLQLKFADDGDYTIIPKCIDKAGNSGKLKYSNTESEVNQKFIIDKTAPEINVSYTNGSIINPLTYNPAEGEGVYSAEAVRATVTIDEKNFWIEENGSKKFNDQWSFEGTKGTNSKNADVEITDYLTTATENPDNGWSSNTTTRTNGNFTFGLDANYTFTFTYTDLAGNATTYAPRYFTVDQTDPTGEFSLDKDGNIWTTIWRAITFDIFRNTSYDVNLKAADGTSGVKSIEYYKTRLPLESSEQVEKITDWAILGTSGTQAEKNGSFSVSPNEQFVVYEKITDYAGRVTYIYPTNGAVADNTRPEITITEVNQSASRNGIYNEDVNLRIDVTDPISGNTYSGLERIWYDVTASGNVSQSETITLMDNSDNRVQSHQGWSGNVTIPAQRYNSNDVRVQVHAVDFSGNQYDSEVLPLKIDVTEPTIQVTYDLNSPLNDRYYNATRTATVVVTDRNFDESAVRFDITNTDGTQPGISGWSHSSNSGVSDDATHTCSVTFSADGDYTFTLNVTDLAGNDSHYTQVDDFTIDQTDPTIQVSYDNNNDAESGYYNADRTATITVTEHNFNESEVNAQITARLQGSGVSAPGVGGWSTRGDVHTASVTFSADADYTFDIDYTDLAGNAAADYTEDSFTIDQTAPEVEFFDIEDKSANKDTVAPGVRYSDVNYTSGGVDITIEGAIHPAEDVDGTRSNIANGESIKMADFAHTEENDDVYTMTAVITDRAGNETEESIVFSVNRFGSTYEFSPETKAFLEDHDPEDDYTYTNDPQDIVVTERNVDTLVFNGISYGRDGTQTDLEEGSDYTVRESGSEVSWKEYMYNISRNNFEEEGHYILNIDSEDRAENSMNNKVKGLDIEFTVDKTVPTLVITGVEEDSYRADTRDMTVNVADNTAVKEVQVLVDGEAAQTYDRSQIEQMGGELTYTIQNANSPRVISAVAVDLAGNETTYSLDHEVLVTSNLLIQYVNNTPLVVGSIIAVIVIAGAAYYFLIIAKRRKKGQEK